MTSRSQVLVAMFLWALSPSGVRAGDIPSTGPIPEEQSAQLGYATPEEALAGLRKKSGVRIYDHDGWTVAEDKADKAVWSFTPSTHPAYPSVVKRYVYEESGKVWVRMGVICGASKEACDALVRDFNALTEQTAQQVRGQSK